jgi:hypothetical protein
MHMSMQIPVGDGPSPPAWSAHGNQGLLAALQDDFSKANDVPLDQVRFALPKGTDARGFHAACPAAFAALGFRRPPLLAVISEPDSEQELPSELRLHHNILDGASAVAVSLALPLSPELRLLELDATGDMDNVVTALMDGLYAAPHITHLRLCRVSFSASSAADFAAAFASGAAANIAHLELERVRFDSAATRETFCASILRPSATHRVSFLESLTLRHCALCDTDLAALAASIVTPWAPSLTPPDDATTLAQPSLRCCRLRLLDLSGNAAITRRGFLAFLEATTVAVRRTSSIDVAAVLDAFAANNHTPPAAISAAKGTAPATAKKRGSTPAGERSRVVLAPLVVPVPRVPAAPAAAAEKAALAELLGGAFLPPIPMLCALLADGCLADDTGMPDGEFLTGLAAAVKTSPDLFYLGLTDLIAALPNTDGTRVLLPPLELSERPTDAACPLPPSDLFEAERSLLGHTPSSPHLQALADIDALLAQRRAAVHDAPATPPSSRPVSRTRSGKRPPSRPSSRGGHKKK